MAAAEQLATPVQFLKGVGPHRVELLQRLGLYYAKDLLFFFPRDYEDLSDRRKIVDLEEGKLQSILGAVEDVDMRNTGTGRCVLGVLVRDGSGYLRGVWFNQPYLRDRFAPGQRVMLSGKPKREGMVWELVHPRVVHLAEDEDEPPAAILPVYPLTEGLQQWEVRRMVREVLESHLGLLEEAFSPAYLEEHRLLPLRQALAEIHFPTSGEGLDRARRRFVYQELFILQLGLAVKRHEQRTRSQAPAMAGGREKGRKGEEETGRGEEAVSSVSPSPLLPFSSSLPVPNPQSPIPSFSKIDARIRRLFPFELTASQEQAIAEIAADMARPIPMNRLLQGDVGSGKTIVAVYAMLLAVAHGYQAVLMAPTEVLARQHVLTLDSLLAASQVRRGQLTGGLAQRERNELLLKIAAGEIDILVGTQAVIQDDVVFRKLGLVVIDEQHRFGVRQRATLKQAALDPHYLVMTATPIPRTVTMTLFGDLEISTLRDLPPGRQKVNTYLVPEAQRAKWWDFFGQKLREGRQAFVVAPLVEEPNGGKGDRHLLPERPATNLRSVPGFAQKVPVTFSQVASLQTTYESLANGPLEPFRLGLIHGRMSPEEKDAAMDRFRSGETQVLVCTSVVEVGVDVPNATLMAIEGGERFGLAQLHQLRGRISRGSFPGFCAVFADPQTDEARERLTAFTSTTDGFRLAEIDFRLRGPGELFGTRQHGLPPFRIADLLRDAEILDEARRDAQALVAADPGLSHPDHARLRQLVLTRYGQVLSLADVG